MELIKRFFKGIYYWVFDPSVLKPSEFKKQMDSSYLNVNQKAHELHGKMIFKKLNKSAKKQRK